MFHVDILSMRLCMYINGWIHVCKRHNASEFGRPAKVNDGRGEPGARSPGALSPCRSYVPAQKFTKFWEGEGGGIPPLEKREAVESFFPNSHLLRKVEL